MAVTGALEVTDLLSTTLEEVVQAVREAAIVHEDLATWVAWRPEACGPVARAGRAGAYDGDAGIAWALAHLAVVLGREELEPLARAGIRHALTRVEPVPGLLGGGSGVALAAHQIGVMLGDVALVRDGYRLLQQIPRSAGADLGDGLAGHLLAQLGAHAPQSAVRESVQVLVDMAAGSAEMLCWPDADPGFSAAGGGLCGMAHGNAGILLALAEAARRDRHLRTMVVPVLQAGLAWENAWFDARTCSWPDLRTNAGSASMSAWCHGGTGIGISRLRLAELAADEPGLGLDPLGLIADAEAALQATLTVAGSTGDLSLCHGGAGWWDLLSYAEEVLYEPRHREVGQAVAAAAVSAAGPVTEWPSGYPQMPTESGLFTGYAGTALVLAGLLHPDVTHPSLFGLPR